MEREQREELAIVKECAAGDGESAWCRFVETYDRQIAATSFKRSWS
jgi:hypothetical protein